MTWEPGDSHLHVRFCLQRGHQREKLRLSEVSNVRKLGSTTHWTLTWAGSTAVWFRLHLLWSLWGTIRVLHLKEIKIYSSFRHTLSQDLHYHTTRYRLPKRYQVNALARIFLNTYKGNKKTKLLSNLHERSHCWQRGRESFFVSSWSQARLGQHLKLEQWGEWALLIIYIVRVVRPSPKQD